FRDWAPAELRGLAQMLREQPGAVIVLASYQAGKLSLVTASASDSGLDALELLHKHLDPLGLRGGGDASMAQGGGLIDESAIVNIFTDTRTYLEGIGTAFN
ncbi:MAG: DHHA1 domain-containing protein, partial [Anaerolineales bacterium]